MTREEAIQELKEINTALESWSGFTKYPHALYIAIDMAIEALSAEPTDLISREEAIEEIENRIGLAWTESEANYNRGMEMALSIIEALPSASAEKHQLFGETSTNTSTNTSSGDLISRAEAHKVLSELSTEGGKDAKMLFMDAHEWIDAIPSADIPTKCIAQINIDADEVVQKIKGEYEIADRPSGEWIPNHDGSWNCSECGLRVLIYAKGNYCPNCGAKMGSDVK